MIIARDKGGTAYVTVLYVIYHDLSLQPPRERRWNAFPVGREVIVPGRRSFILSYLRCARIGLLYETYHLLSRRRTALTTLPVPLPTI